MENPQFSSQSLNHLGLLAGTIKRIKLIPRINKLLPISKEKGVKADMGERVAAMIYNALGFIDNRLYMFPKFLSQKPVDRLLGPHLDAKDFNDDALGRCLDAIYDYGTTQFVSDITLQIASQLNLLGKSIHVDSTSLTVYGEYDHQEQKDEKAPQVTHGYSKQKRHDLKQLVLNLAINNKADLPMFMAAHSGNASDQKILIQATKQIEKCCQGLQKAPSFIYIADSAMYESCLKEDQNLLWISRVPMVRKEAKNFIKENSHTASFQPIENDYKIYAEEKIIEGKKQRWLLVHSKQAQDRASKTLERNQKKEKEAIKKQLWHLSNQTYNCKEDAQKVLQKLEKKWKYHQMATQSIEPVQKYAQKGTPKQGAKKQTIGYKINATHTPDSTKIATLLTQKSHFILATNQLKKEELSDQEILSEYKGQQKVERGFAFIKDNTFEVSSVFLKKPSRISALMAIMVLSLFMYSLTQHIIRKTLKEKNEYVPNQLNKDIQNPTAKWIFFLFRNIQVLHITPPNNSAQEIVINLNPLLERIISYFGEETMRIYETTLPKID